MSEEQVCESSSSVDIAGVARNFVRESQCENESPVDTAEEKREEEQSSCNSNNDHGFNLLEALQKHERQITTLRENIVDVNCMMFLFQSHVLMVRSDIDFIKTMTGMVHERLRLYEEELTRQAQEQEEEQEQEKEQEQEQEQEEEQDLSQEQEQESEQISDLEQVSELDVELDQDLDHQIEPESESDN